MRPPTQLQIERNGFKLELFVQEAENIPRIIRLPFHMNKKAYEVVTRFTRGKIVFFEIHYIITIRKSYMFEPELKIIPKNPVLFVRGLLSKYLKGYDFEFFYQHFSHYIRAFTYYNGSENDIRDIGYVRVKKDKFTYDLYNWGEYVGELKFIIKKDEYIIVEVFWNGKKFDSIVISDFDRIEFFIAKNPKIRVAIESYKDSGEVDEESFIEFLSTKYSRIIEKENQK